MRRIDRAKGMHERAQDLDSWESRGFWKPWKSMLTLKRWSRIGLTKGRAFLREKAALQTS